MSNLADREVQLNFLDEIDEHLNTVESVLIDLAVAGSDAQRTDEILRAVHTIKGIGSMIDCHSLSHIAHRFEDSLKILKVRWDTIVVDASLEEMLLEGLDGLRRISARHRQGAVIEDSWLTDQIYPVFDQLQARLGELQPSDELALIAEESENDTVAVMFQTEVENLLQRLATVLEDPELPCLREELELMAETLQDLGRMLELDRFVQLCGSVEQVLQQTSDDHLEDLASKSLELWQKSQALVLVGRSEKIPTAVDLRPAPASFEGLESERLDTPADPAAGSGFAPPYLVPDVEGADLLADGSETYEIFDSLAQEIDFEGLGAALESFDVADFQGDEPAADLEGTSGAELLSEPAIVAESVADVSEGDGDYRQPAPLGFPLSRDSGRGETIEIVAEAAAVEPQATLQENTVRVPLKLLTQLNDLFGELIVQRNTMNSRLSQLEDLMGLFSQRLGSLEGSNLRLQSFCNQLAIGSASVRSRPAAEGSRPGGSATALLTQGERGFDSLELDRYSDLHLLSQEQHETLVQLQEVRSDVRLNLRDIKQASGGLNQTAKALQLNVTRARMRPLNDIVERFPRTVRELSRQHGKTVELKIVGGATLIDRYVAVHLRDPLMHLLRNAFDHGIEDAESRRRQGKPAQGTIEIRATHRGNQTLISISDDGGGISLDKIRQRALQQGLAEPTVLQLRDAELLGLIFEPGFSTADRVTSLSGRGIGMDVVRSNLSQVRGEIEVDTKPGQGTTFTISVPFTLSIMRVLLVESGGMKLAIPTDSVEEMIRFQELTIFESPSQTMVEWQGLTIPLVELSQWLAFHCPRRASAVRIKPVINEASIFLVSRNDRLSALQFDRFWGEREVVVRQVENVLGLPPGFNGCTVLEDGNVVPLANPVQLLNWIDEGSSLAVARPDPQDQFPSDEPLADTEPPLPASPPETVEQSTIMVVDDSINMRRLLRASLEQDGYRVEQGQHGQDAVDQLLAGLPVHAIICDIEMPYLDGYGLLAEVRDSERLKDIPVIMLTSRGGDKHRQLAMRLGATAYVTKPYQEHELLQVVKQVLP